MNKKIIKPIILSITAIVILVISTIVYAWYTNVDRVNQELDGSTNDIVLDYTINSEASTTKNYSISNLTFFDINSNEETKYLSSMAIKVKLNIKNYSKNAVDVTITFDTNKDDSNAYVDGIVWQDENLPISDNYSNIEEYIKGNNFTRECKIENMEKSTDSTPDYYVYIYLFGVQPNDNKNNDFLYTIDENGDRTYIPYNFTITIKAEKAKQKTID